MIVFVFKLYLVGPCMRTLEIYIIPTFIYAKFCKHISIIHIKKMMNSSWLEHSSDKM